MTRTNSLIAATTRNAWWLVWLLYVALIAAIIPRHEPWFDEAQAWLLARDASWWHLVSRFMRYEGTPALWHTLLRPLAVGGLPYWTLNVFSGLLGISGAFLCLRFSPFPPVIRYLLPFSFFLFYQYTVVARNYSLMPPLVFLLAIQYPRKTEGVLSYAMLLVLLANVSLHGALIAGTLLILHLVDVWPERASLSPRVRRQHLQAVALFAAATLLIVLQLKPPEDLVGPTVTVDGGAFGIASYQMLNGCLTEVPLVSLSVLLASLWWFYRRGVLRLYLVPTAALLVFFALLYGKPWHEGTLLLVWILALWVSFEPGRGEPVRRDRRVITAAVLCVLAFHLKWSAWTYWKDYTDSYSGSRAAALFIKEHELDKKAIFATGFFAPALQPYFKKNILGNYNGGNQPAFFWWSKYYDFHDSPLFIQIARPHYVLVGIKFRDGMEVRQLNGYHALAAFPGGIFWKNRIYENDSYVLLERDDLSALKPRDVASKPPVKPTQAD